MRKLVYLLSILMFAAAVNAQTLLSENFSSGKMPMDGWTIEGRKDNWKNNNSNNAGGTTPECLFTWKPSGKGVFRLISPKIDTKNKTSVKLSFNQYFKGYNPNPYKFGVAVKSGSSAWESVWEQSTPSTEIKGQININITKNLNTVDFQLCFYFDGEPDDITGWMIDDVKLFIPFNKDAKLESSSIASHYDVNANFSPKVKVKNNGLDKISFPVDLEIWEGNNKLYSKSVNVSELEKDAAKEITFTDFTPTKINSIYKVISYTRLEGDSEKTNDSLVTTFDTNQFKKLLVWENFTNTGCGPCASANPTTEKIMKENINDIIPIFIHPNWPDPNDPFYKPIPKKIDARLSYYKIQGVPTLVCDGKSTDAAGSASQLTNIIKNAKKYISDIELIVKGQQSNDKYNTSIEINVIEDIPVAKYTLHVGITETNLDYNAPNGEKHFLWVLRDLFPSEAGTSLTLTKGAKITKSIECPINSSWNKENLDLFVYIQNESTKEIVQAARMQNITAVEEIDYNIPIEFSIEQNYPNPFNPSTVIKYSVKEASKVKITVYDLLGREIKTLINENKDAGKYEAIFNAENLASGVYFYKITAGKYTDVKKMILIK